MIKKNIRACFCRVPNIPLNKKPLRLLAMLLIATCCFTSCGNDDEGLGETSASGTDNGQHANAAAPNSTKVKVVRVGDNYGGEYEGGEFCFYINSDGTAVVYNCLIDRYDKKTQCLKVPAYIVYEGKTFPVTSIGEMAIEDFEYITAISLPVTLKEIKRLGLFANSNLKAIILPDGVETIGEEALQGCWKLSYILLPNSVTEIGRRAFKNTVLTSITVQATVPPVYCDEYDCTNDIFPEETYENAILTVPTSALEHYKSTFPWSKFKTIRGGA